MTTWRARARSPVLWTGVVLALSVAFTWLSLADVSGATRRGDGSCCNTEYVHGWWSVAPTLLVIPIFILGRLSWQLMLLGVAFAGASVFYIAHTAVTRIEDAGWGDGLEAVSYVLSAFQLVLFLVAGSIGASPHREQSASATETSP